MNDKEKSLTVEEALFTALDIVEEPAYNDLWRPHYDKVLNFARSIGYKR